MSVGMGDADVVHGHLDWTGEVHTLLALLLLLVKGPDRCKALTLARLGNTPVPSHLTIQTDDILVVNHISVSAHLVTLPTY